MRVHNHGPDEDCREFIDHHGLLVGQCLKNKRWSVRRWKNEWGVYDRDICHDSFPTLEEAHTFATQCAVADILFESGGLTLLSNMKSGSYAC